MNTASPLSLVFLNHDKKFEFPNLMEIPEECVYSLMKIFMIIEQLKTNNINKISITYNDKNNNFNIVVSYNDKTETTSHVIPYEEAINDRIFVKSFLNIMIDYV